MTHLGKTSENTHLPVSDVKLHVTPVRFEHLNNPLGIGVSRPRLSWITETTRPGWLQRAYEIELMDAGHLQDSTGRVEAAGMGDQSVLVPWPFEPLTSRQQVSLRVRVWGTDGSASDWSSPSSVEAGLLEPEDWAAQFISPGWDEDTNQMQPAPLLRREFIVTKSVRQARLYITSLGVHEAYLNGQTVGDHVLDPGWTSYRHRLVYQTYDVTRQLQPGPNVIGAMLGDGWFRGRLGFGGGRRNIYGDRLALLAQLEITYGDGTTQQIQSDSAWRAATGPILSSDLYDGEIYDARLERPGWNAPGYTADGWSSVRIVEWDKGTLVAPAGPPIRRTQQLAPVAILTSPSGKTIFDFGQNLVGRLRIHVQGPAGQVVTLRHAEVLENGELSTRPLRFARATDVYTLKGDGVETWEPRFTYHGFRYAEVSGLDQAEVHDVVEAVVCHSDMRRIGWFECSDPLINRLHENVVWSMRGNFFSIPTDCPQRDERLGWTGDIQVFAPTASFLYNCAGFLSAWLADLAAEQSEAGTVPFFVPSLGGPPQPPAAAWGDAAVIVPWVLFQRYGDTGILAQQFESMRDWVDLIDRLAGPRHLWENGIQFGDWLDPAAPPEKPGEARTPNYIVMTAYFARTAELVGQTARILGRTEDAEHYLSLAQMVRNAFNDNYVTPAGRILGDSATAYALALQFALLPDESQRRLAGERLAYLLRANRYRITTGFVGTPLICDALCSVGEAQAAYRLLTIRENPSWLYPVSMGATTIWERWDSLLPDGSVNPGEMTSFNHYALGAIADWLHRTVAGLAPAAPGYKRLSIQPIPGGSLTSARARLETPYGLAESAWAILEGQFHLSLTVPPNTTAAVSLPGADSPREVGSGHHTWSVPYQPAEPQRAPLSLDMTIGQLMDYPQAYSRVMTILHQHNYELAARLESEIDMTVRAAAATMQKPEMAAREVEEAMRKTDNE